MAAVERFLSYVAFDTQSSEQEDLEVFPSTSGQMVLLKHLAAELREMGVPDVRQDEEHGYVYAVIPSNTLAKTIPSIGFISHVDTSDAMSGAGIKPRIIENYDGKDIVLNDALSICTLISDFPEMKKLKGKRLIVTDGTTLLGADDKAGVTEIMEMAGYFMTHPEVSHGNICIGFTPDEEIGRGVDFFSVPDFGANYAYTVDGGELGEISYENFNAAAAKAIFHGRSIHPGDAKGKMINAIRLQQEFDLSLPKKERPEYTENREGFFHLHTIQGNCETAVSDYLIREHDLQLFDSKKELFTSVADSMNRKYGREVVEVQIEDSYFNMASVIERHPAIMETAKKAMKKVGIMPVVSPIRGGTDGARLSFVGLPCPNLCTGGGNFHGKNEYLCIDDMEKIIELLIEIVKTYAE